MNGLQLIKDRSPRQEATLRLRVALAATVVGPTLFAADLYLLDTLGWSESIGVIGSFFGAIGIGMFFIGVGYTLFRVIEGSDHIDMEMAELGFCPDCGYNVGKTRKTKRRCPECGMEKPLEV